MLDFEATGLDFDRDEIVSFGVVPVVAGRVTLARATYRIVRPAVVPSAESIRVHGLTPAELASAPMLPDVVDELLGLLEGSHLVAHAAGVELGLLARIDSPRRRAPRRAIDVLGLVDELGRRGDLPSPPSPRLHDIARAIGVPAGRSHHAFSDALTTALLFIVLAARLEGLGAGSIRDLERAGRSQNARDFVAGPP